MRPTVYVETTIPSYYHDDRDEMRHEIQRTRTWWDLERDTYECFISAVVLDELQQGAYPSREECLQLISGVPLLAISERVVEIAAVYQARKLMPAAPVRDALHVALASYYRIEYLLTWNCRHLANANKIRHLEVVNAELRLHVPLIVTPHMLLPVEDSL